MNSAKTSEFSLGFTKLTRIREEDPSYVDDLVGNLNNVTGRFCVSYQ
jgi:hypothetical protein